MKRRYEVKKGKVLGKGTQGQTFRDRDLVKVSPLEQQFEPTEAVPINQHRQMAGVG